MTILDLPDLALVALVGISGSGKSTFARRHFVPSQVLSSDTFRAMVRDDENDQSATGDAFDVLHYVAAKRLRAGRLTVVDATNVQPHARAAVVATARAHDVLPVAIVLDTPEPLCWERTQARPDRAFGREVLRRQHRDLQRSLKHLAREGFRKVYVVRDPDTVELRYERLFNDRTDLTGPFDIVGDVHGCRVELESLLLALGWDLVRDGDGRAVDASHPLGRTAVFVGDLVDRGPDTPGVLRLAMNMIAGGRALCVAGNHENKLLRHLRGRQVQLTHGLPESIAQLAADPVDGLDRFLDGLVSHYVLDGGKLVVAHAGLKEEYHGRTSGRVRAFAMYGDTTGETDEYGLPVRYPWAQEYRGRAMVVYGHTPTVTPEWVNNTICLDTGAVFGARLTALRYPERELVSVEAAAEHYAPARPLRAPVPDRAPGQLRLSEVTGRRHVQTPYGTVTVPAEHSAAALEVMSRFAVDPRWLRWLPPTMAPASTSAQDGYLEHPVEALADLRAAGVDRVVCEEKHMGSRAVVLVCRDAAAAAKRFVDDGSTGVVYTRTGRLFFEPERTEQLLERVRAAVTSAGLWEELETDWLLLDCELLPWSAKARTLIDQYAAVGTAGRTVLPAALAVLDAAAGRGLDVTALRDRLGAGLRDVQAFTDAYRRYAPADAEVTLAPFAVLAAQGRTFADRDHGWHLELADRLVAADPAGFTPTRRLVLDLSEPDAAERATAWWLELTGAGGEGMVVKPYAGLGVRDAKGRLVQPGVKCRGREYLRIIYGPSYTEPEQLAGLRDRRLGRKRSLALREHGLGLAALAEAAADGPLWRVHELVFAILASESEPVDPRL
ncbi:polynucleotide kinase-phosphatase [Catellatospora sp. TT07R-123]|uniref:polynucleotide kinase-phosphatase n=1 Tax=Catellatospora sp. TT07R-123 TaxID=2733863 RepID=UPI001AFE8D75|nr:polynucleotide kinase-phosphatase [Catellatospora sp. TT07R-123]GHJ46726.1 polynucleotide kinase-phosphatase [Catellatospora sp. TT07R-123]